MIKRHIPPKHYSGFIPPGYRFIRYEEAGGFVEGVAHDGKRVVIPQEQYWEKEDAGR